jgi:hypothetical protein
MKHYNIEHWQKLLANDLEDDICREMQQHLLDCEECLGIYLSLIPDNSGETGECINITNVPSPNFTERVMERVNLESRIQHQKDMRRNRVNAIICYISAASITLFLVSGGIFNHIFNTLGPGGVGLAGGQMRNESIFLSGWTDKLTASTSSLLRGEQARRYLDRFMKNDNK